MATQKFVDIIHEQDWIRETADAVQKPAQKILAQLGEAKDVLHGKWLGHPLHPALTDVPIGAWTTALALDAAHIMTGGDGFRDAADLAIGIGLAGAVGSAVTGLADWSETDGRAKSVGIVHGTLNLVATALYTASLLARRGKSRQRGVALSMLGYAVASFSAYLGGHLAYGEQVGVDHTATADQGQPKKFIPVLRATELKDRKPKRVDADGTAVLLVRIGDTIHALANTCTHLGGPLDEGKLKGEDSIRCPWHGSRFCLTDGKVLDGPATFDERLFDVRVRNGQIEVRARS